ncbi:molybdopterin-binding domain-containing protein [Paracraurococcus lichenis]|uniref:Molybdopterin molybdenumtransferase n=1 Tax=Paracraurococcus lichenis TaxID=3064888 RepID=A0ABT9E148_9PROT|nr:molybdopterin biosynthesis protein [Paracraurococcus sp. LOR1-02]MDO9709884.1 molybdopterin biosynthesis protein [Paracraurococcus sp. LOR1-02]
MAGEGAPLRLTAPAEALARLLALLPGPVAPVVLPVAQALGRVLAAPLAAPGPVPAAPMALREGWAVAAADTLGAGPYVPVPLPSAPLRVAAGDPLPPGADAVLPPFALVEDGPFAQATEPVAPGEGARLSGEDLAAGAAIRAAGERLGPRDLPALAACGIAEVAVRLPRLGWLGPEPLHPLLAALVAAEGGALHHGGEGDLLLCNAADRLLVQGLGARPGMAVGLGLRDGRPALVLPPLAEEALAAWYLLGRPALRHLAGALPPPPIRATLARKVASAVGLLEILPVRLLPSGLAEPLATGALPAGALAAADALLLVPPGVEGYEAGNAVELEPL